jgi:hypothetical protein
VRGVVKYKDPPRESDSERLLFSQPSTRSGDSPSLHFNFGGIFVALKER